jgi:methylmalonyl-CoA/ethylmalonyl-CoA epimerase
MRISKKNPLGTNVITQIGIIVRNIDKSSLEYSEFFGVEKPEYILTKAFNETHATFKGKTTEGRAKLVFFEFKNITIELIEPVGGPSTWQEFLDTKGEGVHHIAFAINDGDKKAQMIAGKGNPIVQCGDFRGGCYKYIDTSKTLNVILEFLETKLV